MGINSNNINGNYAIAEDGTIKRPYSELDTAMLNIIRVGANKDDILAAYKARKKCYQLCKESAKRPDYKEYVETLQLDNFPCELKKADYGRRYVRFLWSFLISVILGTSSIFFGCYYIWDYGTWHEWHDNYQSYTTHISWDNIFIGVLFIAFAIALFFLAKYLFKRLIKLLNLLKA